MDEVPVFGTDGRCIGTIRPSPADEVLLVNGLLHLGAAAKQLGSILELTEVQLIETPAQKVSDYIPVLIDFDPRRQIGTLRIDDEKLLPLNIAEYVFAVGAIVQEKDGDKITRSTLHSVSLTTDDGYIAYLRREGNL